MGTGFKHGTSGGTSLNFKVVGNPQPANPKENTIWIDTDQKITGWEFSATQPTGSTGVMKTVSGQTITVADGSDAPMQGLKIFGKTTQNGTPTPDAPVPLESVGDGGSITVNATGKNLFGGDALKNKLIEVANAEVDTDGTIKFNVNKITGKVLFDVFSPDKQYTIVFKGRNSYGTGLNLTVKYTDGSLDYLYFPKSKEDSILLFKTSRNKSVEGIYGIAYAGNTNLYPMECGVFEGYITLDEFEAYVGGAAVTIQKPIDIPVFLPGNPVSSGGNYTDENGQRWFCDYVDFARGVYVQRVTKTVFDGSADASYSRTNARAKIVLLNAKDVSYAEKSTITNRFAYNANVYRDTDREPGFCQQGNGLLFRLDSASQSTVTNDTTLKAWLDAHPLEVVYILDEPIEHDLSAEELAQYSALHTNLPNTTIYNDAGAYMEVKYEKGTDLDGAVWITTGSFSTVAFNALKKNGIQVYPLSAKQYVGGAWVDKEAKSFQDGKWVDWIKYTYLIKNGVTDSAVTGGWGKRATSYNGYNNANTMSYSSGDGYMLFNGGGGYFYTNNIFDLTNVDALVADAIFQCPTNSNYAFLAIVPTGGMSDLNQCVATCVHPAPGIRGEIRMDVSALDGTYRVGICGWSGDSAFTIYDMWTEGVFA